MTLIPTILCGGAGSRLWPVSRELHPKPFIRLADGQSLLQKAWLRGAVLPDVAETLTVTNRELFFKTEDEYREVAAIPGSRINRFILEPFGRNTAPAIAAAALQVAATHGEEACLLVLAADHLIADQTAFAFAVTQAMQLATQGKLVTFGIQPDMPETGYGYIEADIDSPLLAGGITSDSAALPPSRLASSSIGGLGRGALVISSRMKEASATKTVSLSGCSNSGCRRVLASLSRRAGKPAP